MLAVPGYSCATRIPPMLSPMKCGASTITVTARDALARDREHAGAGIHALDLESAR